jgi:hypothetical protein
MRIAEHAELGSVIEPLLAAWRAIADRVDAIAPGVGRLTALAFVTTVDDRDQAPETSAERVFSMQLTS